MKLLYYIGFTLLFYFMWAVICFFILPYLVNHLSPLLAILFYYIEIVLIISGILAPFGALPMYVSTWHSYHDGDD